MSFEIRLAPEFLHGEAWDNERDDFYAPSDCPKVSPHLLFTLMRRFLEVVISPIFSPLLIDCLLPSLFL